MQQLSLSIVLPVSDGAGPLAATVAECLALTSLQGADIEIIIGDASGDSRQAAVADRLASTHGAVAVIRYPRRLGYRQILHDAWGVARGAYVAALDLGGPAAAADLGRLLPALPGHDAVLGYREPAPRHVAETLFATLVGLRLAPGLRDPALGLAIFRADLREHLTPEGPHALAHAAIYTAATARGLAVAQVAVAGRRGHTALSFADLSAALTEERTPAHPDARRAARGTVIGGGVLLAACGLWLLRRMRRQA